MDKKPKTILYGGGDYCTVFLGDSISEQYDVICIVDSNKEKWGKRLSDIAICSPDILREDEYDFVIITPGKWEAIVGALQNDYKVNKNKIYIFETVNKRVVNLVKDEKYLLQRLNMKRIALEEIKGNLLFEAYVSGEFETICEVCVVGTDKDYVFIKSYLTETLKMKLFICTEHDCDSFDDRTLYLLSGASYKIDIDRLKKQGVKEKNMLIIPLFDVENSIIG